MIKRKILNSRKKNKHYNIYIGKNIQEIKKLLSKREEEKRVQIPKVVPGGFLQIPNGQLLEVWNEDELYFYAQNREYDENTPVFDVWDENSLEECTQESQYDSETLYCQYCGSIKKKKAEKCDFCGNLYGND